MKNGLSKLAKDKVILTAMLFCVVLATGAAILSYYNRQQNDGNNVALEESSSDQVALNEPEDEKTTQAFEPTSNDALVKNDNETDRSVQGEDETSVIGSGLLVELDSVATSAEVVSPVDATAEAPTTQEPTMNVQPEKEVDAPVEAGTTSVVDVAAEYLTFSEDSTMGWPVNGEVIREFSMDTTVWFPTLEQYKTSNAIQIQSEVGEPVVAAASSQVLTVGQNDEIGNYVVLDMGNGYHATYGNLQDIGVGQGQYLMAGDQIGVVSQPTRYYTVDGSHLYFQLTCGEEYLDPLDYIR